MIKRTTLLTIICLATSLTACQTTTPTYQQPAPASQTNNALMNALRTPPPPATPASHRTKVWSDSSSKTNSYVQADGTRVTKTTSSSASVNFNKQAAANAVGGLVLAALGASANQPAIAAPLTPQQLMGKWRLYETSGSKSCQLDLRSNQWFGAYQLWAGVGCPPSMFGSMKWNLVGNQILVMNNMDNILLRLNKHQINHWSGTTTKDGLQLTMAR